MSHIETEIPYDVEYLDSLFLSACLTERSLPPAIVKRKLASWPEYANTWTAYNSTAFSVKPPVASPKDITMYEIAIDIGLKYANETQRRLIWAVNHSAILSNGYKRERGPNWEKLAKIRGKISPRALKRLYMDALVTMAYRIKVNQRGTTFAGGVSSS